MELEDFLLGVILSSWFMGLIEDVEAKKLSSEEAVERARKKVNEVRPVIQQMLASKPSTRDWGVPKE